MSQEQQPQPQPSAMQTTTNSGSSEKKHDDAQRQSSDDAQKRGYDADEALKAFTGLDGQPIVLTDESSARLLRIIDWHLMPLMCVVYGMNYLDKTALSYASVMGFKSDIAIEDGDKYQWLGSLFYFGYLAWEFPSTQLLQRLPLAKYSAFCIVIWGLVLACFAGIFNFEGAVAGRFFLGVFESAVTPGFTLLTSQWYTRKEQNTRVNIWFSFNGWGQVFGGLIAYGIAVGSRIHGSSIAPWKVLFLVIGILTSCLGFWFWYVIPDNQLNARWLKEEDRILAIERVRMNQQGIGNKHFKRYQFKEALTDPMTWAFFFYAVIANIPNGGLTTFFSQLIVSFGYTPEQSLLYGIPGGVIEVIALLLCGFLGDKYGNRLLISTSGMIAALAGMIVIVALPLDQNTGRLIGYYFLLASATPFTALLSLIASNVAGYTKKTTVAAIFLVGYCVGNIVGPQVFRPKDKPRYIPACIAIIVCWSVALLDIVFIYWYYRRENEKKAALRAAPGYSKMENQEWMDLTDIENAEFIYSL